MSEYKRRKIEEDDEATTDDEGGAYAEATTDDEGGAYAEATTDDEGGAEVASDDSFKYLFSLAAARAPKLVLGWPLLIWYLG